VAREGIRRDLAAAGIAGRVGADAELVLTELVANAVLHGEADADGLIEVSWSVGADRILLGVRDSGRASDLRAGDLSSAGTSGRGLALVDLFCDRWCWSSDGGTRVDAELLLVGERVPQAAG
jgi:anti-sigma regulatory factor (Ser/Thr protein kinase)